RKLYACYGPQVFDAYNVEKKFNGDLGKATKKRSGQFETFVFVHNDLRGIHPIVSIAIAEAVKVYTLIGFEQFGFSKFRDECCRLDRMAVEDLLGMPLPVQSLVYSPTLDELVPLLDFLRECRQSYDSSVPITAPSSKKLDFNRFSFDEREELRREIVMGAEIDRYYKSRFDVTERDEAAAAFREEYLRIREHYSDPDLILHYLEQYILGNSAASVSLRRGAVAVIAYFLQTCDIFENPPPGWNGVGT
ncbi:MAG: ABC-three component system protein, partial [Pyrinomonadaceae bacterium]